MIYFLLPFKRRVAGGLSSQLSHFSPVTTKKLPILSKDSIVAETRNNISFSCTHHPCRHRLKLGYLFIMSNRLPLLIKNYLYLRSLFLILILRAKRKHLIHVVQSLSIWKFAGKPFNVMVVDILQCCSKDTFHMPASHWIRRLTL